MSTPTVRVGSYYTYCCQLELAQVLDEQEAADVAAAMDEWDVLVWDSLDAVAAYYGDDEDAAEFIARHREAA